MINKVVFYKGESWLVLKEEREKYLGIQDQLNEEEKRQRIREEEEKTQKALQELEKEHLDDSPKKTQSAQVNKKQIVTS